MAFYGSTPGYRQVLDLHGMSDLFESLHELSRTNGWDRMPALVSDEQLSTSSPTPSRRPPWRGARAALRGAERIALNTGEGSDLDSWAPLVARWRAG